MEPLYVQFPEGLPAVRQQMHTRLAPFPQTAAIVAGRPTTVRALAIIPAVIIAARVASLAIGGHIAVPVRQTFVERSLLGKFNFHVNHFHFR